MKSNLLIAEILVQGKQPVQFRQGWAYSGATVGVDEVSLSMPIHNRNVTMNGNGRGVTVNTLR